MIFCNSVLLSQHPTFEFHGGVPGHALHRGRGLDYGVGHFRPRSMPAASAHAPGLQDCGAWASPRRRGNGRRSDRGPFAYTQWGARAMLGPAQHELGYVTRE